MPDSSLGEEPSPNIQPKPRWTQLPAVPSGSIAGHQRQEIGACPSASPCEEAVDCYEVSPQSPLFQVDQAK